MDNEAPKPKTGLLNLQTKLAIAFAVLAIVSSAIVTAAIYIRVRSRLYEDVRDHLRDSVSIGALQVNGDVHATLTDPSQEDSDVYLDMKETFRAIRDAGTNFKFVYSLRNVDGKIYFVVDAEENPEDVSHLGDEYTDAPPGLADLMTAMNQPFVNEEFYTDQWGTFLTGYAPIYKADGTVDAVLGIDIEATNVASYQSSILRSALLIFAGTALVMGIIGWFIGQRLASPILALIDGARRIEAGDLSYKVEVSTHDETSILADAFNTMGAQLRELVGGLENRVVDRTKEVEQRSKYLSAAAEVSRVVTTIHEPNELIRRVVDLIRESFGLYYVGLFMVDEKNEFAVLRAGTGEAGRLMVERGHRIRVGEGMVGWCVEHAQARIAMEAGQDAVRLASPLLPATRSEAALPLRLRDRVAGALTVQSDQPDNFDDAIITVLQTMVDQVSIALDNARLFSESDQALKQLRRAIGDVSRQAWKDELEKRSVVGYYGNVTGVYPIDGARGEMRENRDNESRTEQTPVATVQIPLRVRDQVLGVVEACKSQAGSEWSKEETDLLNTLVDQLGVAIDNARLYEQSQRKAERERILSEITGHVRSTTDINLILQTAVRDLAEALRVPKGMIRLIQPSAHSQDIKGEPISPSQPSGNGGTSNG